MSEAKGECLHCLVLEFIRDRAPRKTVDGVSGIDAKETLSCLMHVAAELIAVAPPDAHMDLWSQCADILVKQTIDIMLADMVKESVGADPLTPPSPTSH